MRDLSSLWTFGVAVAAGSVLAAQRPAPVPASSESPEAPAAVGSGDVEFGSVRWSRDFDAAQRVARTRGLPMLVLFQEVPG